MVQSCNKQPEVLLPGRLSGRAEVGQTGFLLACLTSAASGVSLPVVGYKMATRADRRGQQVVPLAKHITVVVVGSLAQTWQTK